MASSKAMAGRPPQPSAPGKDSTFHVYWPAIAGSARIEMEPAAAIAAVMKPSCWWMMKRPPLMVERSILERLGYRVDAFTNHTRRWPAFGKTQRF
ncbi:MAG: hypothetical protein R2861_13565 [Desulfobacterales bacterium]